MNRLLFGTAGIPLSTPHRTTSNGIRRVRELGLDCMEIEFVEGFYLKKPEAEEIGFIASDLGVTLSVHAPYYLNFNAHEIRKIRASQGMLHKSVRLALLCRAKSVVFHPGFYLGASSGETYNIIKKGVDEVISALVDDEIGQVKLRPEVSGKKTQFGSLDEILALCREAPHLAPCIDFAHLHARSGSFNSYDEFALVLDKVKGALGPDALDNMHIHISGIRYGKGGETSHLALSESDFKYEQLLKALKDLNVRGSIISESPKNDEDALILQKTYSSL